ncbi:ABC transporter permease, partial [Lentilactobacillus parabuchneri]|nr:ABC transporter permease [Lentilactobacillus parabuchneri]
MGSTTGFKSYFQFHNVDWGSMMSATWETVWMTLVSM